MLELDLILMNFLEQQYLSLSQNDQENFVHLLECTDAELADWLLHKEKPPENFCEIIKIINAHADRIL